MKPAPGGGRKLRICFVADPGHPNTHRWTEHLARELGHEVWVLATGGPPCVDSPSYRVVPVPVRSKIGYLTLGFRIRRHLRSIRPDLLVGYRVQSNGLAAALSGFRPLVLAAQTQSIVWPPDSRLYGACVRFALRRADLLQAWGGHMRDRMVALGADPARILTAPRGVNTSVFHPPAAPPEAPVLIVTRALRAVYNHATLFRAFALLLRSVPDARLVVAGDGPERAPLENLARDLGCPQRIEFTGFLAEARLAEALRSARCYVTVVGQEGVSSSLLEAMSCGLLPAVPDLHGNREWVADGDNGVLLPIEALDNPERLSHLLIRSLMDRERVGRAFTDNPRLVAQRADWNTNMKRMEAAYLELAGAT